MTPVVAVIAPGAMGAAVGKRLVDNGAQGADLAHRPQRRDGGAGKAAGMAAASDEEIAAPISFFRFCRRATRWRWRAFRAGAERQQRKAGLCRLQRHQSGDRRARRRRHRADRTARSSMPASSGRRRSPRRRGGKCGQPALLRVGRRGAALCRACAITALTFACSTARSARPRR